jgi:hypothetical protein
MLTKYSYLSNIALDFDVSVQRAIWDVNDNLVEHVKHLYDEISSQGEKELETGRSALT